jgi:hypothetical protein
MDLGCGATLQSLRACLELWALVNEIRSLLSLRQIKRGLLHPDLFWPETNVNGLTRVAHDEACSCGSATSSTFHVRTLQGSPHQVLGTHRSGDLAYITPRPSFLLHTKSSFLEIPHIAHSRNLNNFIANSHHVEHGPRPEHLPSDNREGG